jgi:hypothetical protein
MKLLTLLSLNNYTLLEHTFMIVWWVLAYSSVYFSQES